MMSSMNIIKNRTIATIGGLIVAAGLVTGATFALAAPAPVSEAPAASQPAEAEPVDFVSIDAVADGAAEGGSEVEAPEVVTPAPAPKPVVKPAAPKKVTVDPPAPVRCPGGSTAAANDGVNDTLCFPDICFSIALPDSAHPECDVAFKP